LGRWTDTRRLAQAILDKAPANFVANMAMASAAAFVENPSEQERYLRVALQAKDHPFLPAALNNLAYCLSQQGRFDEALPYAQDAVRQNPEFDKALHTLAAVQVGLKQYAAAEQTILQALTFAPANAQHKLLQAEIVLAQGRAADARRLASQAMPDLEDKWRIRAERILHQAGQ
jgi:Tfp pilus assembly protein PilF